MKPRMLITIFIIAVIFSFLPIFPNPDKKGINFYNPLVPARVNVWKAMS